MKALYLVTALAAVGCSDITSPPTLTPSRVSHEVLANEKGEFSIGLVACNGEFVFLTGKHHYVVKAKTNKEGDMSFSITDDAHFKGVSDAGNRYEGSMKMIDQEASHDDEFSYYTRSAFHLVRKGKTPDDPDTDFNESKFHNEWTWDVVTKFKLKNGELEHDDSKFTNRCR